jgi:periplasmic protein CpxP/Spy
MKRQIAAVLITVLFSIGTASAQGGGSRKTVPERVKEVMEKLVDFKLDKSKSDLVDSIFTNYFTAQQKMAEEMRAAGGTPDRDAMRETRKKQTDERDIKLKAVFTEDQFKKWKDEIEPSMRPARGNGPRGGGQQ